MKKLTIILLVLFHIVALQAFASSNHYIGTAGYKTALTPLSYFDDPCPNAGSDGLLSICESNTTTIFLFAIISGEQLGGNWTRTSGTGGTFDAVAGTFTPAIGATNSTFEYTIPATESCPEDVSLATIVIIQQPATISLTGNQDICIAASSTFSASVSDGTWSSSNNTIATVNSVTGEVTGITAGTAIINYTVGDATPCESSIATRAINVTAPPVQPTIQGYPGICLGSWTTFMPSIYGGTWSSSNSAVAMVDNTGFVLGMSSGYAVITYTLFGTGGCGNRSDSKTVRVTTTPSILLASAPETAYQTVCLNAPITPIVYSIGTLDADGGDTTGLPQGLTSSYNAGIFTISGTPTQAGTFPYTAYPLGHCGFASSQGTITVTPSISTTLFCDPSQVTGPNKVFLDWSPVVGATNYQYEYAINDGTTVSGTTALTHYEISNVLPGQSVIFTITNAMGVNCFQAVTVTCSNLADASFETNTLEVFPNPVTSILTITNANPTAKVQVFNALGQQVISDEYHVKTIQVDMTALQSGIYLVKIVSDKSTKTIKVIKN